MEILPVEDVIDLSNSITGYILHEMENPKIELTWALVNHWIFMAEAHWKRVLHSWKEGYYAVGRIVFPVKFEINVEKIAREPGFQVPGEEGSVFATIKGVELKWGKVHNVEVHVMNEFEDPPEVFSYQIIFN